MYGFASLRPLAGVSNALLRSLRVGVGGRIGQAHVRASEAMVAAVSVAPVVDKPRHVRALLFIGFFLVVLAIEARWLFVGVSVGALVYAFLSALIGG